jgi:hypothetical protein
VAVVPAGIEKAFELEEEETGEPVVMFILLESLEACCGLVVVGIVG